jgi:hypothetical protein
MQVASRIWCLWGIVVAAPGPTIGGGIPAKPLAMLGPLPIQLNLISLLTAWCLSEVIRYGFFALKELLGEAPYISTWLRWVAPGVGFLEVGMGWSARGARQRGARGSSQLAARAAP